MALPRWKTQTKHRSKLLSESLTFWVFQLAVPKKVGCISIVIQEGVRLSWTTLGHAHKQPPIRIKDTPSTTRYLHRHGRLRHSITRLEPITTHDHSCRVPPLLAFRRLCGVSTGRGARRYLKGNYEQVSKLKGLQPMTPQLDKMKAVQGKVQAIVVLDIFLAEKRSYMGRPHEPITGRLETYRVKIRDHQKQRTLHVGSGDLKIWRPH